MESGVDAYRSIAFMPSTTSSDAIVYTIIVNTPEALDDVRKTLLEAGLHVVYPPEMMKGPHTPDDRLYVTGRIRSPVPGTIYDPPIIKRQRGDHERYGVLAVKTPLGIGEHLPNTVPNHIVSPTVLCLLGAPPDPYMDSYDTAKSICPRDNGWIRFQPLWRMFKRYKGISA